MIAFVAAYTLIIGAGYSLWLVKRIIYGPVANDHVAAMQPLDMREWIVLAAFALGVLAVGVYPKFLTDLMEPAVQQIVSQLGQAKV